MISEIVTGSSSVYSSLQSSASNYLRVNASLQKMHAYGLTPESMLVSSVANSSSDSARNIFSFLEAGMKGGQVILTSQLMSFEMICS